MNEINIAQFEKQFKARILAWLPVMIEEEKMGINPVLLMLKAPDEITIEEVEMTYKAITVCKVKYPKWYSVMAKFCNPENWAREGLMQ